MPGTEIVIGLVGGIGTNFDLITKELETQFLKANCNVQIIKLTELLNLDTKSGDYLAKCSSKIAHIDKIKIHDKGIGNFQNSCRLKQSRFALLEA